MAKNISSRMEGRLLRQQSLKFLSLKIGCRSCRRMATGICSKLVCSWYVISLESRLEFNIKLQESQRQTSQQVLKHLMEQRRAIGQAGIRTRRYASSLHILLLPHCP
jgi:peroxygenase